MADIIPYMVFVSSRFRRNIPAFSSDPFTLSFICVGSRATHVREIKMGLLSKLLPSEDKFFALMKSLSAKAEQGTILLKQFTESPLGPERDALSRQIESVKAEAKDIMNKITHEVAMSFITPFDREDIQEFSLHLYKIPKTIDKIRERLELHNIRSDAGEFSRQVELIVEEAAAMQEIVEALTNKGASKTIAGKVEMLHDLESRGDEVLGDLLARLFADPANDARELILKKDIYDMLEKVLDRYRDAAAVALQIVLKHS